MVNKLTAVEQLFLDTLTKHIRNNTSVTAWMTKTQINVPTVAVAYLMKLYQGNDVWNQIGIREDVIFKALVETILQYTSPGIFDAVIAEWLATWERRAERQIKDISMETLDRMIKDKSQE